jgi:hypothetical protein
MHPARHFCSTNFTLPQFYFNVYFCHFPTRLNGRFDWRGWVAYIQCEPIKSIGTIVSLMSTYMFCYVVVIEMAYSIRNLTYMKLLEAAYKRKLLKCAWGQWLYFILSDVSHFKSQTWVDACVPNFQSFAWLLLWISIFQNVWMLKSWFLSCIFSTV